MKISFFISLFLCLNLLTAQTQNLSETLSQKACECAFGKDTEKLSPIELNKKITGCIESTVANNMDAIAMDQKISATELDDKKKKQLTYMMQGKLSRTLVKNCPDFAKTMTEMTKREQAKAGALQKAKGRVKKIEIVAGLAYVVFTNMEGETENLLWFSYFKGSEYLGEKQIKILKKGKVEISWKQKKMYQPETKKYIVVKEIVSLKKTR